MEMFEKAFSMFTPFARREGAAGQDKSEADKTAGSSEDIDALKRQIEEMQRRIDQISDKS